jgi:hypothetical protein
VVIPWVWQGSVVDARDSTEREIIERWESRRRGRYMLLGVSPFAMIGAHLAYLYPRGGGCGLGCLSVVLLATVVWALAAAGITDLKTVSSNGTAEDPLRAALSLGAILGLFWLHGILSSFLALVRGAGAWRSFLASRANSQIMEHRRRLEAAEEEKRRKAEADAREAAARAERERIQRERDRELVPLYGGRPEFVDAVRRGQVAPGMTMRAVRDALGAPADVREEITARSRKVKLLFGRTVGKRGGVSFRREVTLVNDVVTHIKDL